MARTRRPPLPWTATIGRTLILALTLGLLGCGEGLEFAEPERAMSSGTTCMVSAAALNLRAGAGTGYSSRGMLHQGDMLLIVAPASSWPKVRVEAVAPKPDAPAVGQEGFVHESYISCGGASATNSELIQALDSYLAPASRAKQVGITTASALAALPRSFQYDNAVTSRLGLYACGLVAAASPFHVVSESRYLQVLDWLGPAAGSALGRSANDAGIAPTKLTFAHRAVFGQSNVSVQSNAGLVQLYQALAQGKVVMVDLLCGSRGSVAAGTYREIPAISRFGTFDETFAHYARVLGLDHTNGVVHLENTIDAVDAPYWSLSYAELLQLWLHPETRASSRPEEPEDVNRWMVAIVGAVPQAPSALAVSCGGYSWISTCESGSTLLQCHDGVPQRRTCSCQPVNDGDDDYCR